MRSVKCLCWMISLCLSGIQFSNQVVSESKKKSLIHCTYKSCKIVRMCTTRRERQSMIAANILCTSNDFLFSFSSPSSSVCVWLYASRKSSPSTFVDSRLMWNQCDFTSTKNKTKTNEIIKNTILLRKNETFLPFVNCLYSLFNGRCYLRREESGRKRPKKLQEKERKKTWLRHFFGRILCCSDFEWNSRGRDETRSRQSGRQICAIRVESKATRMRDKIEELRLAKCLQCRRRLKTSFESRTHTSTPNSIEIVCKKTLQWARDDDENDRRKKKEKIMAQNNNEIEPTTFTLNDFA